MARPREDRRARHLRLLDPDATCFPEVLPVLAGALAAAASSAPAAAHRWTLDVAGPVVLPVAIDGEALGRLVRMLLDDVVAAALPGSGLVVDLEAGDDVVVVRLADDGRARPDVPEDVTALACELGVGVSRGPGEGGTTLTRLMVPAAT